MSYYNPNTPDTNSKSIFLIEKAFFNRFFRIISSQNQLPLTFSSDLVCNKTIKARNSTFLTFNIPISHKFEQKVIRK